VIEEGEEKARKEYGFLTLNDIYRAGKYTEEVITKHIE